MTTNVRLPLSELRLRRAKYSYTTRYVADTVTANPGRYHLDASPEVAPRPGDVALARVVAINAHTRLESPVSRRSLLYPGDEIVVAYGNRYAPDAFEAEVPEDLSLSHLVAAGGLIGRVTEIKEGSDEPTALQPLGLLADQEGRLTLGRVAPYAPPTTLPTLEQPGHRPPTVAVVGTSMNSGKSTALASFVRGLTSAGLRVGAGKATGTGAGGDPGMYADAGAVKVLDFTDFGHASTYRLPYAEVTATMVSMVQELSAGDTEAVVVEIADGLFQDETARLLDDPLFGRCFDAVVFAAGEALSAVAGVSALRQRGIEVAAVSGRLTAAPLAVREARLALDVPVITTRDLTEPEVALCILPTAGSPR